MLQPQGLCTCCLCSSSRYLHGTLLFSFQFPSNVTFLERPSLAMLRRNNDRNSTPYSYPAQCFFIVTSQNTKYVFCLVVFCLLILVSKFLDVFCFALLGFLIWKATWHIVTAQYAFDTCHYPIVEPVTGMATCCTSPEKDWWWERTGPSLLIWYDYFYSVCITFVINYFKEIVVWSKIYHHPMHI